MATAPKSSPVARASVGTATARPASAQVAAQQHGSQVQKRNGEDLAGRRCSYSRSAARLAGGSAGPTEDGAGRVTGRPCVARRHDRHHEQTMRPSTAAHDEPEEKPAYRNLESTVVA